jgi:hypothetical protein|tara:strand:+ start:954 stop:1055 length:102 start_codon:yes stop_codon:yes gene_type:complete
VTLDIDPADDPVAGHWSAAEQIVAMAQQRRKGP